MIVQCISFGTAWWFRLTKDEATGALILSKSAYFNTSGFVRGSKTTWRHRSRGFVRINANAVVFSDPSEIVQAKFQTSGVERFMDSSRLLLERKISGPISADAHLVAIRSDREGEIDFTSRWRTEGVRVVASSVLGDKQETLILVPAGGRIYTNLGEWEVIWRQNRSRLSLVE